MLHLRCYSGSKSSLVRTNMDCIYLQVPDERQWLVIVSSEYDHYIWFLRLDINQQICDRLVELNKIWTQCCDLLSLVKKWDILSNINCTISNAFKVSLTKSFPVVQEKNDRSYLWQQKILDGQKVKFSRSCPLTSCCFDPCKA